MSVIEAISPIGPALRSDRWRLLGRPPRNLTGKLM